MDSLKIMNTLAVVMPEEAIIEILEKSINE